MKSLILLIIPLLMVVTSCNDHSYQPVPVIPKDSVLYKCATCPEGVPFDSVEQCPLPFDPFHPKGIGVDPPYIHFADGPSANGDYLIISSSFLLNLKTLNRVIIDVSEYIKNFQIEDWRINCFSPRDNSKVLITCTLKQADQNGRVVEGWHLYILDFETKEIQRVTPSKFGEYGEFDNWGYSWVSAWSYDPITKTDRLHFTNLHGTYVIQEDRFIENPITNSRKIAVSPDMKFKLVLYKDVALNKSFLTLNGTNFQNPENGFFDGYSVAWSKDSRYLAISGSKGNSNNNSIFSAEGGHIWIYDFKSGDPFSSSFTYSYKITPRKQFCKYLDNYYNERQLAFVSPNTLGVALRDHTGGGVKIHEISIDGKYVRQLTFNK